MLKQLAIVPIKIKPILISVPNMDIKYNQADKLITARTRPPGEYLNNVLQQGQCYCHYVLHTVISFLAANISIFQCMVSIVNLHVIFLWYRYLQTVIGNMGKYGVGGGSRVWGEKYLWWYCASFFWWWCYAVLNGSTQQRPISLC